MQDSEVLDLAEKYRREHPEIECILQIFEDSERYLHQLDQLEQLEESITTISSNTKEGLYAPPTIPAPVITATASTRTDEFSSKES